MKKFYRRFIRPPLHILAVIIITLAILRLRVVIAQAKALHFGTLPEKQIILTRKLARLERDQTSYWQLPGGNAHQNKVLRLYQDALRDNGLQDREALRYGSAILVSENEPLTLDRVGDHGHSYGICQRNLGRVMVKDFLKKHPEEGSVEAEVAYCSGRFAAAFARYGNVYQASVEHNCPACAARYADNIRLKPSYFTRVKLAASKLTFL